MKLSRCDRLLTKIIMQTKTNNQHLLLMNITLAGVGSAFLKVLKDTMYTKFVGIYDVHVEYILTNLHTHVHAYIKSLDQFEFYWLPKHHCFIGQLNFH